MEQSNSSNPNQNNDVRPSRPFSVKGKYKPKNAAPNTTSTEQPFQQPAFTAPSGQPGEQPQGQPNFYGQPPYGDQPPYYGAPPIAENGGKLKHSGLGITSFVMSLLSVLAIVIGIIIVFSSVFSMDESDLLMLQDPTAVEDMLLTGDSIPSYFISVIVGGVLMMASAGLAFIGLILGFIGLFIKQRRKVFSILGTIFNGLIFVGGILFILISFISAFAV